MWVNVKLRQRWWWSLQKLLRSLSVGVHELDKRERKKLIVERNTTLVVHHASLVQQNQIKCFFFPEDVVLLLKFFPLQTSTLLVVVHHRILWFMHFSISFCHGYGFCGLLYFHYLWTRISRATNIIIFHH